MRLWSYFETALLTWWQPKTIVQSLNSCKRALPSMIGMIRTHRVTLRACRARIFPKPSFLGLETKSTMQWERFESDRSCSPLARSCSAGRSPEQTYSKVRSVTESAWDSAAGASGTGTAVIGATSTVLGAAAGAVRLNAKRPPALPLPPPAAGDRISALTTSSSCSSPLTTCREDRMSMLTVSGSMESHPRALLDAGHRVARVVSHRSRLSATLRHVEQEN
jgi:hypothetical protein